jgi:hypothetical protein
VGGGHRGAAPADLITFKQRLRKATLSAVAPDEPSRLAVSRITARAWMAKFCESLSIGRHNTNRTPRCGPCQESLGRGRCCDDQAWRLGSEECVRIGIIPATMLL